MPGIFWAALVAWSALTGSALLGPPRAWDGVDPRVNKGHYRPEPVEYRSWTSSPRREADGSCIYRVVALVTREQLTRVRLQGVEQLLDWSWGVDWMLFAGQGGFYDVTFLAPVGGRVVAQHSLWEKCWPKGVD